MKQAIVIPTVPNKTEELQNLFGSLNGFDEYPVIILADYTYELGKVKFMVENTDFDEFFLLQHSCEIKDTKLFDILFQDYLGKSVSLNEEFSSYLFKYRRDILLQMDIPTIDSKLESIRQERNFHREYCKIEMPKFLFDDFVGMNKYEEKFGRKNQIMENEYIKKYKGTWDLSQLGLTHEEINEFNCELDNI